jgi:hypothetical protein
MIADGEQGIADLARGAPGAGKPLRGRVFGSAVQMAAALPVRSRYGEGT